MWARSKDYEMSTLQGQLARDYVTVITDGTPALCIDPALDPAGSDCNWIRAGIATMNFCLRR